MKKFLILLLLLVFGVYCYFKFYSPNDNSSNYIEKTIKNTEEDVFLIDHFSIFGTHLNIRGCINKKLSDDLSLILSNGEEEISIQSNFTNENTTCFYISDNNNEGIYLDELNIGQYLVLIKEKNGENIKYYRLENNTKYNNLTYYTITRDSKNNKVEVNFEKLDELNYLALNIQSTNLPSDVYDITIDAGHGGNDSGAIYKMGNTIYKESDITLKVALLLKEKLENNGLKVKITRDSDERVSNYGDDGRAVIPNSVKSKYNLSIHVNSDYGIMPYGGVEVYTPNNVNYKFAKILASNVSKVDGYSKNPSFKVEDGIYYKYFTKKAIEDFRKELLDDGLIPYEINEGTPYMFMIREIGGINTHAYIDGRNEEHGINKYFNSNQTAEPYLVELGYINYESDLKKLLNNPEEFAEALSNAFVEYLEI